MEENNNNNQVSAGSLFAFGSVFFGGLGLAGNFFLMLIWSLPSGIFLGFFGIACAVLSKKGKPFTQQAQLGLILSVISVLFGVMTAISIIFIYDTMDTNTAMGNYFRQIFETAAQALLPSAPAGE